MDAKTVRQKILQIGIIDGVGFLLQYLSACGVRPHDLTDGFQLNSPVPDVLGGFCSFFARVDKNQHLVLISSCMFQDLGIADIVHGLELLDGFLVSHANEFLFQRTRSECAIKVEKPFLRIDSEKSGDISIVGKRCTQSHNSDWVTSLLNLADGSADDALNDGATVIM